MAVLDNILSKRFTSDGTALEIIVPCDFDYINVVNITKMNADATNSPKYEFYVGMTNASQIRWDKSVTTGIMVPTRVATGGFTVVDTTQDSPGAPVTITDISNASPPVVSTATTTGLANGDIVRIINAVNSSSFDAYNGIDYTIGALSAGVSFTLAYMVAAGNSDTAQYRRIPYDPMYYPRRRIISKITTGTTTEIFMTVTHGFTVGQRVTFNVTSANGMTQLNGLRAQIIAINTTTNSITVNIDSSGFTAYSWPSPATIMKFTPGQVVPFGDAPATLSNVGGNQSVLDGATRNTGRFAVTLAAGATSPGGEASDDVRVQIYKGLPI